MGVSLLPSSAIKADGDGQGRGRKEWSWAAYSSFDKFHQLIHLLASKDSEKQNMETGDSSGTFEAHLQHPTNFSSTQISRFNNVRDSSKNHLWKMKDVFQSHPQPEKAALKPVESPDSSLRFLQILQLRLDLAIVWSGSLGIGDIGHWGLVKKILQTKKNIGCTHPMIQDKHSVVTEQRFIPSSSSITQHHPSTCRCLHHPIWGHWLPTLLSRPQRLGGNVFPSNWTFVPGFLKEKTLKSTWTYQIPTFRVSSPWWPSFGKNFSEIWLRDSWALSFTWR